MALPARSTYDTLTVYTLSVETYPGTTMTELPFSIAAQMVSLVATVDVILPFRSAMYQPVKTEPILMGSFSGKKILSPDVYERERSTC